MTISTGSVVLMTMYLSSISVIVERRRNSAVNSSSLLMRLLFSSVQKNTRLFRIGLYTPPSISFSLQKYLVCTEFDTMNSCR